MALRRAVEVCWCQLISAACAQVCWVPLAGLLAWRLAFEGWDLTPQLLLERVEDLVLCSPAQAHKLQEQDFLAIHIPSAVPLISHSGLTASDKS